MYPLYITITAALAVPILLNGFWVGHWKWQALNFAANVLLIQSCGLTDPIDGPSWSISTELAAYIVFPVLLGIASRRNPLAPAVLFGASMLGLWLATMAPTPTSYPFPRMGPLDISWARSLWPLGRCIFEFSIGVVAFVAAQNGPIRGLLANQMGSSLLSIALLTVMLFPGADLLGVALLPAFLISLLGTGSVSGALSSRLALYLGRLSYAVYLLHGPMLHGMREMLGESSTLNLALAHAIYWVALIAVAHFAQAVIEKPGRDLVRAMERRWFPRTEQRLRQSERSGAAALHTPAKPLQSAD